MIVSTAEQKIIYAAYMQYASYNKKLDADLKSPIKVKKMKEEVQTKQNRFLLSWRSDRITSVEKDRLVTQSKLLFVKYCKLRAAGGVSKVLEKNMEEILDAMAAREAEVAVSFKKHEVGGDKLDLSAILSESSMVIRLINESVKHVLEYALKNDKFTVVKKKDDTALFITASGKKYHRKGCPYCHGKLLTQTSFAKIENMGLNPCRCISEPAREKSQIRSVKLLTDMPASVSEKAYPIHQEIYYGIDQEIIDTFSVFIDESIRKNPCYKIDPAQPELQSNYSYVICKGRILNENQISSWNILSRGSGTAVNTASPQKVAIEAIQAVLIKIAFEFCFLGTVVIYTDNTGAQKRWAKVKSTLSIAELFDQVIVCYVPREMNTMADAVGNDAFKFQVSETFLKSLVNDYYSYMKLREKMETVYKYFPNPERQIPNLISELELLAGRKEKNID